jgi:hypothetical protein
MGEEWAWGSVTPAVSGVAWDARGGDFGASPTELTWEARFGLPNWAWLRGIIRMTWAVPGWTNRANKQ